MQPVEQRGKICDIKRAGRDQAEASVRRAQAGFRDHGVKLGAEAAQRQHFRITNGNAQQAGDGHGKNRLKGIAQRRNSADSGSPQKRFENRGEDVRVLVGVKMRNGDARRLYFLKLRYGLGFDFFGAEAMGKRLFCQLLNGAVKKSGPGHEQRRYLRRRQHRPAIGEHDMAADAERRAGSAWGTRRLTDSTASCKFVAVCHQRRRGHNSALMTLQDGAIDAAGQAEVVGVYNEPLHPPSLDRSPWQCRRTRERVLKSWCTAGR